MTRQALHRQRDRGLRNAAPGGFALIEVLVTLLVLLIGLLGLAGLLVQSQRYEIETYQRAQALIVLQDMVDRIKSNRQAASCYAITTNTSNGAPYMGTGSTIAAPTCTVSSVTAHNQRAVADLVQWNSVLLGATELLGPANAARQAGGLINARGCVSFDATTRLYTVTVAWQGLSASAVPGTGTNCGKDQYGTEADALRRVVTLTMRLADLNA